MTKRIIVNADDLGLNLSVNTAIIESFNKGFINSATLMANMPGFESAIELIHNQKISRKIGIHLVLTDGIPLTKDIKSMSLFFKKAIPPSIKVQKLIFLSKSEKLIIFKEYSAQIEKVRKNRIPITHIDTHHQIHDMWGITQVIIELLKVYNIPSMRILNNLEKSNQYYKTVYRNLINHYLKRNKINFTDFLGSQLDFNTIMQKHPGFLKKSTQSVEIMVHPNLGENNLLIDRIKNREYNFEFLNNIQGHLEA